MNLGLPYQKCNLDSCLVRTRLLHCSGCDVARYCSVAHQRADRSRHKVSCGLVKQTRAKLRTEEALLRAHTTDSGEFDMFVPANPFESAVGSFWSVKGTRPYMQARHDLVTALLNIRTGEAVDEALIEALDMLRLCPGDNLGVRGHVPALYLRLGRDQEAYDFIKFYMTVTAQYEWGNPEEPFLHLHGQDAMEGPEAGWDNLTGLSMLVSLVLIKVRLSLDIIKLASMQKQRGRPLSDEEKMAIVKEEAMSDILLTRTDIVNKRGYPTIIEELSGQVHALFKLVHKRNKHFWPAILNPGPYANAVPTAYTLGSKAEINLVFRESWYSWSECSDAIDSMRKIITMEM